MKKILLSAVAGCCLAGVAFASTQIAVLDFQKILQSSPQAISAQEKLKKEFIPQQEELKNQQAKLKALLSKYNQENTVLKDSQRKAMEQKIIKERSSLITMLSDYHQRVLSAKNKMMNDVVQKVQNIVKKVAQSKHIDLVLLKSSVPYASDNLDITQDVLQTMK